jgi:hypothetical protein
MTRSGSQIAAGAPINRCHAGEAETHRVSSLRSGWSRDRPGRRRPVAGIGRRRRQSTASAGLPGPHPVIVQGTSAATAQASVEAHGGSATPSSQPRSKRCSARNQCASPSADCGNTANRPTERLVNDSLDRELFALKDEIRYSPAGKRPSPQRPTERKLEIEQPSPGRVGGEPQLRLRSGRRFPSPFPVCRPFPHPAPRRGRGPPPRRAPSQCRRRGRAGWRSAFRRTMSAGRPKSEEDADAGTRQAGGGHPVPGRARRGLEGVRR